MSRIERAKAAGWRIECLGDQQEGLFNYLLWSPDNGYSIQTEYPLVTEDEAWDYFYGFVVGLPATEPPAQSTAGDVQCRCGYMASQHWADGSCPGDGYPYDDAPENHMSERGMAAAGDVTLLTDDEQRIKRLGVGGLVTIEEQDGLFTAIVDLRAKLAAAETLAATNARLLDNAQHELDTVRGENARLRAALEPFAEAWLQVPYGLTSTLRVWNGHYGDEAEYPILGVNTDDLEAAHTAYFGLPAAPETVRKLAGEG